MGAKYFDIFLNLFLGTLALLLSVIFIFAVKCFDTEKQQSQVHWIPVRWQFAAAAH